MRVLGLETSCDETSVAIVHTDGSSFRVKKNLVASQIKEHARFGGVVPELAARRHVDALFPLLIQAGVSARGKNIDAVAVTSGPGLVGALRVGVEAAKNLAFFWKKPLIAVNHMEGHIYSAFLDTPKTLFSKTFRSALRLPTFPALALLVSGGHTELVLMRDHGDYDILGMTRDDAAGEAFDKVAKMLGLSYPGGPIVSKLASQAGASDLVFPRPMLDSSDLDFSFSGLKTAVAVYLRAHPAETDEERAIVCAAFQEAVVDCLVGKTLQAAAHVQPKTCILAGGVSANTSLRMRLALAFKQQFPETQLLFAPIAYVGDNAAMIALAGAFQALRGVSQDPLSLVADPHLSLGKNSL